jgi:Fe-S cluster biogenesis protein NfuA
MDVCAELERGDPFAAVSDVELAKQVCGVQGAVTFDQQTWEKGSIEEEISELLEDQIRPFVQDDGGDIQLISFEEHTGAVTVQLVGACSGCPSSASTLQGRVETLLKHYVCR